MTHAPRFALLFAVLFGLIAPTAPAQTPATTVKDSEGTVVFQSNVDGGLLAPGEFGTGTIPAEGSGTRLMWSPVKAAVGLHVPPAQSHGQRQKARVPPDPGLGEATSLSEGEDKPLLRNASGRHVGLADRNVHLSEISQS
jgi:hypothetical protein